MASLFRKPKARGNTRQRIAVADENDDGGDHGIRESGRGGVSKNGGAGDEGDDDSTSVSIAKAPTSLRSFDDDEGVDSNFEIKKSKRYMKEQKRQKKLEALVAREIKEEEEDEEEDIIHIKKEEPEEEEDAKVTFKAPVEEKRRDNASLRTSSIKADYHEDPDERDDVATKFTAAFKGIPDSKAVFEARKRREEARRRGDTGYIPLDDDKKLQSKGERRRLVREDENDDSDDEQNFYSAKALLKEQEERRRDAEMTIAEQEDDEDNREADEWEKMQIRKAVSHRNVRELAVMMKMLEIGELRQQQDATSRLMRAYEEKFGDNRNEVDMDVDIGDDVIERGRNNNGVMRNIEASHADMPSLLERLRLRIRDREEALNTRRYEVQSNISAFDEKKDTLEKIRSSGGPALETKYAMLQRIRVYSRCLLECLNDKVAEINELSDDRRRVKREKMERIEKRRRRDLKDSYEECAAAAAGKNVAALRVGDHATRASDREARRARRRREREGKLKGVGHDEGLSSDDEETTSQSVVDAEAIAQVRMSMDEIFSDALPEYSSISIILERILEWLATDAKSFTDSFVALCLPKLASPFVRMELIKGDVLEADLVVSEMKWYQEALKVADEAEGGTIAEHEVVVNLIPSIVEKVVLPFLTDVAAEEWEPLSLSQSTRMGALLRTLLFESPSLGEKSRSLRRLLQKIIDRFNNRIDDDLFAPMFARQAMDSLTTGCRAFADRQFWTAVKLLRCISSFAGVLSPHALAQLHFAVTNRVCLITMQLVEISEPQLLLKVRAILRELDPSLPLGSVIQTRNLLGFLKRVRDLKTADKELERSLQKSISQLEIINADK